MSWLDSFIGLFAGATDVATGLSSATDVASSLGTDSLTSLGSTVGAGNSLLGAGTGALAGTTADALTGGIAGGTDALASGGTAMLDPTGVATSLGAGAATPSIYASGMGGGGVVGSFGGGGTSAGTFSGPQTGTNFIGSSQVSPIPVADSLAPVLGNADYGGQVADANGVAPNGMPLPPTPVDAPPQGVWDTFKGYMNTAGEAIGSPAGKAVGAGIAGANLVRNIMTPNHIAGVSQLTNTANQMATNGAIYQGYLQNGTLPPGLQTAVDQAAHDAAQAIKASYASRGIAPGSSMETQDINRVQQNAVASAAQMADQLLAQGLSMTQISSQIYQTLANLDQQQSASTGAAIGNLASALSGGGYGNGKGTTINIPSGAIP